MKMAFRTSAREKLRMAGLLIAMMLAIVLSGCNSEPAEPTQPTIDIYFDDHIVEGESVTPETDPPTEPTEPVPTAPADGNPDDITCQGSYTGDDAAVLDAANTVVAKAATENLTNRQLQVYYWMEVAAYRAAEHDVAPDFTQPLDVQLCDLDDTAITWQQYFLQRALNTWYSLQALELWGLNTPLELEEAYQPNAKSHRENITADLPALSVLYGYYNKYYQPNDLHKAFLDNIPTMLEELATGNGYADLNKMLTDLAGAGADAEALAEYAYLYNWAYMYYTQLSYDLEPTTEEVEAYFLEHEARYANAGITLNGEKTVSFRHVLLIPEGAEVAWDGTVSASVDAWQICRTEAEKMLAQWQKDFKKEYSSRRPAHVEESEFGELAFESSADLGSAPVGGLYSQVCQGQLCTSLDNWLFDAERQYGDIEILRSDVGYHIVYFCGTQDVWYTQAQKDLLGRMTSEILDTAMANYTLTVNYASICLGQAQQSGNCITSDDVLYPDVAHERFPTVPLFLQKDYPTTMYGRYPIVTYGCGITTMAMLASYMTDTEWTPPELCELYGDYCFETGSDYALYDDAPCELGFYGIHRTYEWDDVAAAVHDGDLGISLQRGGYWTRRGHYILLQNFTEDGLVCVRDSNILNYGTIKNHKIDAHEVEDITKKGILYWIVPGKVVRTAACARCDDTTQKGFPEAMFTCDYICSRCDTAVTRRDNFINAIELAK